MVPCCWCTNCLKMIDEHHKVQHISHLNAVQHESDAQWRSTGGSTDYGSQYPIMSYQ